MRLNGDKFRMDDSYELCEFYYFRHPTPRAGFLVCNGGVIAKADEIYPLAWAYLQTAEGELLCKTQAQWTDLSTAAGGVGGAPFFVIDLAARTIRLPDIRGDYPRGAGGGTMLNVGDWHGDAIRNITANFTIRSFPSDAQGSGAFENHGRTGSTMLSSELAPYTCKFNASRVVPTAAENRTRAIGLLPCVYIGGQ
jgi:hypothetical protein